MILFKGWYNHYYQAYKGREKMVIVSVIWTVWIMEVAFEPGEQRRLLLGEMWSHSIPRFGTGWEGDV